MKKQIDVDAIQSQFQERLNELQFEQADEAARILVVNVPDLDYGPLISHLMLGMQLGYILHRSVVFRPDDDCKSLSLFAPLSRMSYMDVDEQTLVSASFDVEQFESTVLFDYAEFWENHRLRKYFFPWAPPEFQGVRCARLLFDGEFHRRMQLDDELERWLIDASAAYLTDEPVLGLYRRTSENEAIMETASDEQLLTRVLTIAENQSVDRVYVAGFDEDADPLDGLNVMPIEMPDAIPAFLEHIQPSVLQEVLDLHVLSACGWIIGRPSADIARHAAARIGARTQRCDRHSLVQPETTNGNFSRLLSRRTSVSE